MPPRRGPQEEVAEVARTNTVACVASFAPSVLWHARFFFCRLSSDSRPQAFAAILTSVTLGSEDTAPAIAAMDGVEFCSSRHRSVPGFPPAQSRSRRDPDVCSDLGESRNPGAPASLPASSTTRTIAGRMPPPRARRLSQAVRLRDVRKLPCIQREIRPRRPV